jgi:hypothetical protein
MLARTMPISPCYAETMLHARNWPWERSNMQNFFDAFQPYSAQLKSGHFSYAIDCGLAFLNEVKRRAPAKYDTTPKGTPFYLLGIAAFHAHDYQTATFLFDAAVSEDLQHHSGKHDQPALLFMRLEDQKQNQAALEIVKLAVKKLRAIIRDYWPAPGSEDTELGVLMELEVGHGETEVHAGVQARGCAPDQGSRRVLCSGVRGLGRASVAVARLGEEVRRRSGTGVSWPRPDEAGAARDRASQARGHQAEGRARHPKKRSWIVFLLRA